MYSVLLVDDEKWIVRSLRAKADWESFGFRIAGEAYNGEDALRRLEEECPDVVLTDIRMPGISGLVLMARARERGIQAEFVVISGYSEFNYVKQALQLGAADYLLKPVDEKELADLLILLKSRLDQAKRTSGLLLASLLQNRLPEEAPLIRDILLRHRLPAQAAELSVICVLRNAREADACGEEAGAGLSLPEVPHLLLKTGRRSTGVLIDRGHLDSVLAALSRSEQRLDGVGVGVRVQSEERLEAAIQTAAWAASSYFLTGVKGGVHVYREPAAEPTELLLRLAHSFKSANSAAISDILNQLKALFREGHSDIRHAVQLYGLVQTLIMRGQAVEEEPQEYSVMEDYAPSYSTLLELFGDAGRMIAFCAKELQSALLLSAPATGAVSHAAMKGIVAYMEEYYADNLSLSSVAERFKLHPNYVSNLFQRELKSTFTKHLMKIRLDHACALLTETELSINAVAERAGYEDYFYFAKIFKKQFGVSPSHYRLNQGLSARL
ncbi:response regulator [Cohnella fermenti]|uniref:Response regulator n=1 Tax=Cohnella fermenti TaxID=2565925 RepID=A0A4S4BLQ3_9BACL|nr:response regulator [Cohnella fermenti]THF75711.1 response regulator [Cohnella fermenti]